MCACHPFIYSSHHNKVQISFNITNKYNNDTVTFKQSLINSIEEDLTEILRYLKYLKFVSLKLKNYFKNEYFTISRIYPNMQYDSVILV